MATQFFLHDAASDLGGSGQKAMDTARGSSSTTAITNTTASGTNIQVTKTAGGTALTWFTAPLNTATVSGSVTVNIRGLESSTSANAKAGITIEHTDSTGSVLGTIVANTAVPTSSSEYTTSDTAKNASFTPTSTSLSAGDRIKVTLFVKNQGTMGGSLTVTNSYDGASSGATGDTYVTFTETLLLQGQAPAGVAAAAGVAPAPTVTGPPPQVTVDSAGPSSSGKGQTGTGAISWTHVTVAASTLLVAAVSYDGDSGAYSSHSATLDGTAMNVAGHISPSGDAASNTVLVVYWLPSVSAGSHTFSSTPVGGSTIDSEGGSIAFTNVAGSIGTAVTAAGISVSVSTTQANSLVAGFAAAGNSITATTAPAVSQFVINEEGPNGGFLGNCAGATSQGTGSSVTMAWTTSASSNSQAALAFEVLAPSVTNASAGAAAAAAVVPQAYAPFVAGAATSAAVANQTQFVYAAAGVAASHATGNMAGKPYPAAASADGTYMVDQYGQPIMVIGEDIWALVVNGGRYTGSAGGDWTQYFATRAAQGYNLCEVSMISSGDPNDNFLHGTGQDWDGQWPFSGSSADPSGTPDSTFWARRDLFVSIAAQYGVTVVFNAAGVGTSSVGASWTTAQWSDYGTFLGDRYASQGNIIWINGDGAIGYSDDLVNWRTAIRATGDTHVITLQTDDETTSRYGFNTSLGPADPMSFSKYAELDWVYTYIPSYVGVIIACTLEPSASDVIQGRVPVFWADGFYVNGPVSGTDGQIETNMWWWALTSGACGVTSGDNNLIGWGSGSQTIVNSTWYNSVPPAVKAAFGGLPGWWKLRPDTGTLVTSSHGTKWGYIGDAGPYYTSSSSPYPDPYITSALAADGTLALIYCAASFSVTIDQTKMVAGYTATWVDPASGAATATTAGSSYSSSGLGNNSAGYPDWLLVLQQSTGTSAPAGAVASAGTAVAPVPAVTVHAGVGAAAAAAAAPAGAATATAGVPAAAGAAPAPAPAVTVTAGVGVSLAAAPGATVTTSSSGTGNAAVAVSLAAVPAPVASAGVPAGVPAAASLAAAPVPAAGAVAVAAASGAGVTGPSVAVTVTAGAAVSLAADPGATVSTSSNVTANAGVAAVLAVAPVAAAAHTAAAGIPAVLAAVPAASPAGTATAGIPAALGVVPAASSADTATAGVAVVNAAAPGATVSTPGSTTANAGVAAVAVTAPPPVAATAASAGPAAVTTAALAVGHGTLAGVAAVTTAVPAPVLAATAITAAAQALAAALAATGAGVEPFTVGKLTAPVTATSALTASTAPSSTITAAT